MKFCWPSMHVLVACDGLLVTPNYSISLTKLAALSVKY